MHNGLFIIQILCYMCASLACQTCSTPLLTQHYEIRQCVLLQMCRQQGTPSPLAGPLFRFQLYFSFPLNPGPAAEEMTIEGEIHNISSHLPTLPTHSLISPSMRAKMAFFFSCPSNLFNFPPHFLICTSTCFISKFVTLDPCNWYFHKFRKNHTCTFGFFPPFPLRTPSSLTHKESGMCSPTSLTLSLQI